MGGRIAARLLAGGHRVVVWNRTPARAADLVRAGAEQAASPAAAVEGVAVAITMVADPAALAAVSSGPSGFCSALRPGQTLLELSTVGPAAVARLRSEVPEGVAVVDAPVIGSIEAAEGGTLTIFVGGIDADVERVRPLLTQLGTPIHVGAPGAGAAAKLVANSTLFGVLTAFGEAVALADCLGLDRETTFAVLEHTPLASQVGRRRDAIARHSYPPRFGLSLARKDAALVAEAAHEAGVTMPVAEAALSWLEAAERAGAGASDYAAVLETILRGAT
jgi:3-hydroxyisobutyrate dehydrogenase-like beta-hydroxyacid dehydrogenase